MNELIKWFESHFDCTMGPPLKHVKLKDGTFCDYRTIAVGTWVDRWAEVDGKDNKEAALKRCYRALVDAWEGWLAEDYNVHLKGTRLYWRMADKVMERAEDDFDTGSLRVQVLTRVAIPELLDSLSMPYQHAEGSYIVRIDRDGK